MSCMIAPLPGGIPEIFPARIDLMHKLEAEGLQEMRAMIRSIGAEGEDAQYIGSALKPDRSPFHLTTLLSQDKVRPDVKWWGSFYAPFGIGEVLGTVQCSPDGNLVTLAVNTWLRVDGDEEHVAVDWEVRGSQITKVNKAALIKRVNVRHAGPHVEADVRRCVALHAPQRVFGEPSAIIAMQCGVAAACLIEAIC